MVMKFWIFSLFFAAALSSQAQLKASDFDGEYYHRHSLYMRAENRTVHGVMDTVRIRATQDQEAQILVETYSHNFHSCQLIGTAHLEGEALVFKSQVNPELNRGKKALCVLKITKTTIDEDKAVQVSDQKGNCKLQYCGMQAQLDGRFRTKSAVKVQEKN